MTSAYGHFTCHHFLLPPYSSAPVVTRRSLPFLSLTFVPYQPALSFASFSTQSSLAVSVALSNRTPHHPSARPSSSFLGDPCSAISHTSLPCTHPPAFRPPQWVNSVALSGQTTCRYLCGFRRKRSCHRPGHCKQPSCTPQRAPVSLHIPSTSGSVLAFEPLPAPWSITSSFTSHL